MQHYSWSLYVPCFSVYVFDPASPFPVAVKENVSKGNVVCMAFDSVSKVSEYKNMKMSQVYFLTEKQVGRFYNVHLVVGMCGLIRVKSPLWRVYEANVSRAKLLSERIESLGVVCIWFDILIHTHLLSSFSTVRSLWKINYKPPAPIVT